MKGDHSIIDRLADRAELSGEPMPEQTIVELAGDRRVLIEHHFGVIQYCAERIGVKVKYGQILICGCGLELTRMTREQLVISGRIDSVTLLRRTR